MSINDMVSKLFIVEQPFSQLRARSVDYPAIQSHCNCILYVTRYTVKYMPEKLFEGDAFQCYAPPCIQAIWFLPCPYCHVH